MLEFQRLPADEWPKCCNRRRELGQQVRRLGLIVGRAGLCRGDPDADQIPADAMSLVKRVQRLSCGVFGDNWRLKLDAVAAMPGHDISPIWPFGRG